MRPTSVRIDATPPNRAQRRISGTEPGLTPRPWLLDYAQAARVSGVSVRKLRDAREKRQLPIYKIGARIFIAEDDLRAWVESQREDPTG